MSIQSYNSIKNKKKISNKKVNQHKFINHTKKKKKKNINHGIKSKKDIRFYRYVLFINIGVNNTFVTITNGSGHVLKYYSVGLLQNRSSKRNYRYVHREVTSAAAYYLFNNQSKLMWPFILKIRGKGPKDLLHRFFFFLKKRFSKFKRRVFKRISSKSYLPFFHLIYNRPFNGCRASKLRRKRRHSWRVFSYSK